MRRGIDVHRGAAQEAVPKEAVPKEAVPKEAVPPEGAAGVSRGAAGWMADTLFVVLSTLLLAALGSLVGAGALPFVVPGGGMRLLGEFYEALPAWGGVAFGVYMGTATLLGLVLPGAVLAVWGRNDEAVLRAFAPYALVLVWQVFVEFVFARAFFPNIVVFVGLVYTAHRIWQLRRSCAVLSVSRGPSRVGRQFARGLLTAGLVLWSVNLVFLLAVMLPRVLELP